MQTPFNIIFIFQEYPNLLSQAVYISFCESFIDSYSQFGEKFKETLVDLVYLWITGLLVHILLLLKIDVEYQYLFS